MSDKDNTCCPEMPNGEKCDHLDFVYRLTHVARTGNQRVPVEVGIHVRFERCTGPLELGNLVYSTTLLPQEKVRLFTMDRRSRFTFDQESDLSYRHETVAEEQYYMDSFDGFMSNLESVDSSSSSSSSSGSASSSAGTSGLLGTIVNGPSVSVSGQYNASSTSDFLRELSVHAESSHNRSVNETRRASSVSVGEVNSRQHAEGESESQLESSSRVFHNPNKCHAVSYLFHQVNKVQTVRLTIQGILTRVIDPVGDSAVINRPIGRDASLSAIPAGVLANSSKFTKLTKVEKESQLSRREIDSSFSRDALIASRVAGSKRDPIDDDTRAKVLKTVQDDLRKQGLIDSKNKVSDTIRAELEFEFKTTLPTPGIVVRGCLDDCETCEPELHQAIELDLEKRKLKNKLLARKIELLDQASDYRCCPVGEEEPVEA